MTAARGAVLLAPLVGTGLALLAACGNGRPPEQPPSASATPAFEPPVVVNPESPVNYPQDLWEQQVEGRVVLRLHLDERGNVVPESTRVSESSGYPALDSAALRAVPDLRFAPARRDGQPVATTFLQPVDFRHQQRTGAPNRP
ncbi:MAG: energy transducer TonB [Gemmatimonadetes bacterium]|nr:energy transducer TonB [Gemmatimonadota bacterium]MBI2535793.1 energy transducer TonB [Gemmatimonadota bacterium]MBI2615656.1 energy transducer TonB [Gemmatimonadota bacterium]